MKSERVLLLGLSAIFLYGMINIYHQCNDIKKELTMLEESKIQILRIASNDEIDSE